MTGIRSSGNTGKPKSGVEQGGKARGCPRRSRKRRLCPHPLQENLYGTACYAILPLSERALHRELT